MGVKLLDPVVDIGNIEISIDKNAVGNRAEDDLKMMQWFSPLIKMDNHVFNTGQIISFRLDVKVYDIPRISIVIDDNDFVIRKLFKNNLTEGVCRIGYKNWAIKFNVLFDGESSVLYKNNIIITGCIWNEKLYTTSQESFKNNSITDILKSTCSSSNMGLYIYDNSYLSKTYNHLIRSNETAIDYMKYIIDNYTDNMWCIDPNYFLHVGDYDNMIKQPISEYTLNYLNGETMEYPLQMIFHYNRNSGRETQDAKDEDQNSKIPIDSYKIDTDHGDKYMTSKKKYINCTELEYETLNDDEFGIGTSYSNIFSKFTNHIKPYISDIRQKLNKNKTITLLTRNIIPEINIFDIIKLELFNARNPGDPDILEDQETDIDIDNSGNKLVIGYSFIYEKMKEIDMSKSLKHEIICI